MSEKCIVYESGRKCESFFIIYARSFVTYAVNYYSFCLSVRVELYPYILLYNFTSEWHWYSWESDVGRSDKNVYVYINICTC